MEPNKELESKLNSLISKQRKVAKITSLVGITIAILGFGLLLIKYVNQKESSQKFKQILTEKNDFIDSVKISKKEVETRKKQITNLVVRFLDNIRVDSIVKQIYADTVERYYLKERLTWGNIKREMDWYYKKNPKVKLVYNPEVMNLDFKSDGSAEVLLPTTYFKDSTKSSIETINQIRINKGNKIYYIRNLIPN